MIHTTSMSSTVRMCRITLCKREAATFCYHCQQDVCHTHFAQHSSMLMTDVYSLADRINILTEDITTFSTTQMREDLLNQLQQWEDEAISLIKNVHKQKQTELNEKIGQFDRTLGVIKEKEQQKISEVKKKVVEMIDNGEVTFDQVNRLRTTVDEIAIDVDKLRVSTIRLETKPVNLDGCRIISVNEVQYMKPQDIMISAPQIPINNNDEQPNRSADHFGPFTTQSMARTRDNTPPLSTAGFDPRTPPYPSYDDIPIMNPFLLYPPLPSFSVPPPFPAPSQMVARDPNIDGQLESMEQQEQAPFTTLPYSINMWSRPIGRPPYLPFETFSSEFQSPDSAYINQHPAYFRRDSSEDSSSDSLDSPVSPY